jgi:threonine dehydratase
MTVFTTDRIAATRAELAGQVIRTPILPLCGSKIAPYIPAGAELFLKLELFQHTGSFKARGATLGVGWLADAQRQRGVTTFSGGNHALAVAWAARKAGVPAKVVMTEAADPFRIEGCRALGAEIVLVPDMMAAVPVLNALAEEEGRQILHPFNDVNMAYGAASCGAEMVEDCPPLDLVVLPVGGGGLISGMAAAIKHLSPSTTVIGVEPEGADSLGRSFRSGRAESLDRVATIADSLGAPMAMPESLTLARRNVDELITIPDGLMADTMLLMRHTLNLIAEPACTASLAATLGPLRNRIAGQRVGVLACGSNISMDRYATYTESAHLPLPPSSSSGA